MADEDDDLAIDHDELLSKLQSWRDAESDRASGAAETRGEIGQYLEATGLNKKALATVRALDKMKPVKRGDCLRSLHALLDTMEPHWAGQGTADMFDEGDNVAPFDSDMAAE